MQRSATSFRDFLSKTAPVGFDGELTTIILVFALTRSRRESSGWKVFSLIPWLTTLPPAIWTQGSYETQAGSRRIVSSPGFRTPPWPRRWRALPRR